MFLVLNRVMDSPKVVKQVMKDCHSIEKIFPDWIYKATNVFVIINKSHKAHFPISILKMIISGNSSLSIVSTAVPTKWKG